MDANNGWYAVSGTGTTNWVHAVIVYHGLGNGFTVYEDGTQIGADLDITIANAAPSGNGLVYIGRRYISGDRYATATVDEIKFYNRQLTQQEICDMY